MDISPVGVIRTPFTSPEGMPVQPCGAIGTEGTIDLLPEYLEGLKDIDGFERLFLIYQFHKCTGSSLTVIPYLDTVSHGIFATRSPKRPNLIGISVVRLKEVRDNKIIVLDIDVLDGTPLLDIKPYVPDFDSYPGSKAGWLEKAQKNAVIKRADKRFH